MNAREHSRRPNPWHGPPCFNLNSTSFLVQSHLRCETKIRSLLLSQSISLGSARSRTSYMTPTRVPCCQALVQYHLPATQLVATQEYSNRANSEFVRYYKPLKLYSSRLLTPGLPHLLGMVMELVRLKLGTCCVITQSSRRLCILSAMYMLGAN